MLSLLMVSAISSAQEIDTPMLAPRTSHLKTFPCLKCHTGYKSGEQDTLKFKDHAGMIFQHMPEVKTCRVCHSPQSPNRLNLMDGTLVELDQMDRVCGQCHGKVQFEWGRSLHGKQAGSWLGPRQVHACADCHNPHAPKFPLMMTVETPKKSIYVIDHGSHK